ncbi:unnamed protein product, partial [Prunus brigantina]
MTGPLSSSNPSQAPPPAAVISLENEEERTGFDRNFADFVLRRPATIFGDPVRVRLVVGSRFLPLLAIFRGRSKNKSDSKWGFTPRIGSLVGGLEFFRPPKITQCTHTLP